MPRPPGAAAAACVAACKRRACWDKMRCAAGAWDATKSSGEKGVVTRRATRGAGRRDERREWLSDETWPFATRRAGRRRSRRRGVGRRARAAGALERDGGGGGHLLEAQAPRRPHARARESERAAAPFGGPHGIDVARLRVCRDGAVRNHVVVGGGGVVVGGGVVLIIVAIIRKVVMIIRKEKQRPKKRIRPLARGGRLCSNV